MSDAVTRRRAGALSLAGALALAAACAVNHFELAREDERNNRWEAAYTEWKQLLADAEAGHESTEQLAVLHYNFGRAAGVTCRFDEAEKELQTALQLDEQTNGPTYMSLFNLAQLELDQKKWAPAIDYFDRGLAEMERVKTRKKEPIHPAAVAYILDQKAMAQRGAGQTADAAATLKRAAELREQEKVHLRTDRAPYGTRCAPGTTPPQR